jgi:hypothetical protein
MFRKKLYLFSTLICIVLMFYAVYVYPIPGTDSIVFIPPALLYSKGLGLTNPLYYVTKFTDLTHTNKFNYYVPFYSFFLGLLSKIKPGIKTIFFICAVFSSANILLYNRIVLSFVPEKIGAGLKIIILLSVTYIATYLLPTVGRPENFTTLFVFVVYIIYNKRGEMNKVVYYLLITLLFSLMLSTQLLCFFFCFMFYVLYDIINAEHIYKVIFRNLLLFLCSVILFCVILQCTPNGLINTITGIKLHIQYVLGRADRSWSLFIYYWVLAPLNFGFLIIFLLSLFFFIKEIYKKLANAARDKIIIVVIVIVGITASAFKFILYAGPTVYTATEFILPLSAYLIYNIIHVEKNSCKKIVGSITMVTFLAGTLIFIRGFILFVDTLQSGKGFDSARPVINKYLGKRKNVYITGGLWSLFDDLDNLTVLYDYMPGDTVAIQQSYTAAPITKDRFTILYDWRTIDEKRFLGIKLSNRPYGYGFVICKMK